MTDSRASGRIWRVPEDDSELLDRLLDLGLVDDEDVDDAEAASEADPEGRPACLFIIEDGLATADQMRRLTNSLHKLVPTCYQCLKRTSVPRDGFDGTYICRGCDDLVAFADGTAGLGEALLPHVPSRITDAIAERLLVKRESLGPDQLAALRQARKTQIPRPTLTELISRAELMSRRKVRQIERQAARMARDRLTFADRLEDDAQLSRFLVQLAVAGQAEVSQALVAQLERALASEYEPLRDLLLAHGQLTPTQLEDWLPDFFDDREQRAALLEPIASLMPAQGEEPWNAPWAADINDVLGGERAGGADDGGDDDDDDDDYEDVGENWTEVMR